MNIYFKFNGLLFEGQHEFRMNHTCDIALHEFILSLNENRNIRLTTFLLFNDFRKAFNLIDSRKLLRKLFHYGFDNSVLNLISNYFNNRLLLSMTR